MKCLGKNPLGLLGRRGGWALGGWAGAVPRPRVVAAAGRRARAGAAASAPAEA